MTLEHIQEIVCKNSEVFATNESLESGDISQAPSFINKLIHQTFSKSIVPKITSVMPLKTPSGFIYNLLAYYQGTDADNTYDSLKVVKLASDFAGTLNTNITLSNSAVVTVEYFEGKVALIKVVSGSVVDGLTFTGNTINSVHSSKIAVKKLFKNYSKVSTELEEAKNIGIKIKRSAVEVTTRKLKSTITQEAIQDLKAQYGEDAEEVLADIMSTEIALEMDKEIIDYMRSIATLKSDLVLTNTNSADLSYAFRGIATKVNTELVGLSQKHGKNITGFIVCSNKVVSGLISAGVMTFGESGNLDVQILTDNNSVVGVMQQYVTVIQDKFAAEDYVLVGWKQTGDGVNGKDGNAGLIFSPYSMSVNTMVDPETGKVSKLVLNRYGVTRNAYDEGDEDSSDFFSLFNVDFSSLVGYEA